MSTPPDTGASRPDSIVLPRPDRQRWGNSPMQNEILINASRGETRVAILERGTHDQLVGRKGLYAELHRKQLLEEELAAS